MTGSLSLSFSVIRRSVPCGSYMEWFGPDHMGYFATSGLGRHVLSAYIAVSNQ